MKTIFYSLLIMLMIFTNTGCSSTEVKNGEDAGKETVHVKLSEDNYEKIYSQYIEKMGEIRQQHTQYDAFTQFERGMALADINGDGVPELFTLDYSNRMRGYNFENGELVLSSEDTVFMMDVRTNAYKYYESPLCFCGIYKEKESGERAIVSYYNGFSEDTGVQTNLFKVIGYENNRFVSKDVSGMSLEELFQKYKPSDDEFAFDYVYRGWYDVESGFAEVIKSYKNPEPKPEIKQADDGEYLCYIKDIDMEKDEITLIPARMFSCDEYKKVLKAYNEHQTYTTEDGYNVEIKNKGSDAEHVLFYHYDEKYMIRAMSDDGPDREVSGYKKLPPIKAKYEPELMLNHYMSINEDGTSVYDGKGEVLYPIEDYFANLGRYATYSAHGYEVVIKDGTVTNIRVPYVE